VIAFRHIIREKVNSGYTGLFVFVLPGVGIHHTCVHVCLYYCNGKRKDTENEGKLHI